MSLFDIFFRKRNRSPLVCTVSRANPADVGAVREFNYSALSVHSNLHYSKQAVERHHSRSRADYAYHIRLPTGDGNLCTVYQSARAMPPTIVYRYTRQTPEDFSVNNDRYLLITSVDTLDEIPERTMYHPCFISRYVPSDVRPIFYVHHDSHAYLNSYLIYLDRFSGHEDIVPAESVMTLSADAKEWVEEFYSF